MENIVYCHDSVRPSSTKS